MTVEVKVPTILRTATGGEAAVSARGRTLREALDDLEERYPGIRRGLLDEGGALHRFVNVYVNEEDVRYLGALETELRDGDVISILPAVAGGH